jgi:glycosyltransferase involved in cell wall biosynthesis
VSGLLVPAGDTDQLVATLDRVLTDEQLRARLAAGGLARAGAFEISRAARRIQAIYEEIVAA